MFPFITSEWEVDKNGKKKAKINLILIFLLWLSQEQKICDQKKWISLKNILFK